MTLRTMNTLIRKTNTLEDFNIDNFKDYNLLEIYGINVDISDTELTNVLKRKIYLKDNNITKFVNECQGTYNDKRYIKYLEFRKTSKSDSSSKKFFLLKYGDTLGLEKFEEKGSKTAGTLYSFISKYGETEGTLRYNSFCEKNKGNHTLERKIELYGIELGEIKYKESQEKLKNKNTLSYYKKKFGTKEGARKYNEKNTKNSLSSKEFASNQKPGFYDNKSLTKLIEKYGLEKGTEKHINNSIKLRKTLQNRSEEDKKIWLDNIRKTMEKKGIWSELKYKSEIEKYQKKVWAITRKQDLSSLKNIDKRVNHAFNENAWHLDHKISIQQGFEFGISAEEVGNIDNLQMLQYKENISKHRKSYSAINRDN